MHSITLIVKVFGYACVFIMLWSFAGSRQRSKVVNKVVVNIENDVENHFVDAEEIEAAISKGQNNMVFMRWYDSVSLQKMEHRIEKIDFVKKAQASHDLAGNLTVQVKLVKPVARIVAGGSDADRYLGSEGEILPTSEKYVSKVLTMDGPGARRLPFMEVEKDTNAMRLVAMIGYIQDEPFWKAQIAHMYVDEHWEVTLYPQVGQQLIEFGPATDVETKFKKLEAFYEKIIPAKGWSAYQKVSIKYNNQIVCQKSS